MDKKNNELANEIPVDTSLVNLESEKARRKTEMELEARARKESIKHDNLSTDELKTRLTEEEIATTTQLDQFNSTEEVRRYIRTNTSIEKPIKKKRFWPFGKK